MAVVWPQSVPLCVTFSVLAGVFLVLSTVCLAVLSHREKKGADIKRKWWALGYVVNISLQIMSFVAQTFSTFVGPISIAVPVSLSSQLLTNFMFFSVFLKYEELKKDILIGTLVDAVGVILLFFVGSTFPEENPDIQEIFQAPGSIAWASVVIGFSALVFPYHFILGCSESSLITDRRTFTFLMMSEVFNSVLAASTLKMLALTEGSGFAIVLVVTVYANSMLLYASMLQAVAVKQQSVYVPIAVTLYLGATGITGVLIWDDVIQSIGGYVCVFALFALAATLLSDFEVLKASNAGFKYGSAVEIGISMAHRSSVPLSAQWASRRGISTYETAEVYRALSGAQHSTTKNARNAISQLRQEGGANTASLRKKPSILNPSSSKGSPSVSFGNTTSHGEEGKT
jgi:hypothetical protein